MVLRTPAHAGAEEEAWTAGCTVLKDPGVHVQLTVGRGSQYVGREQSVVGR
ncbi:hypothetical protein [Streptomyces sp. NPDC002587]